MTAREPTFSNFLTGSNPYVCNVRLSEGQLVAEMVGPGRSDNLLAAYIGGDYNAFFNFSAQRLNIGRIGFSSHPRLAHDAANLPAPEVIAREMMEELEAALAEIAAIVEALEQEAG